MSATEELLEQYNYDEFVPEKFHRWMKFDASPPLGQVAPDFPLWPLDGESNESKTALSIIWSSNLYTIVEFGSFT